MGKEHSEKKPRQTPVCCIEDSSWGELSMVQIRRDVGVARRRTKDGENDKAAMRGGKRGAKAKAKRDAKRRILVRTRILFPCANARNNRETCGNNYCSAIEA